MGSIFEPAGARRRVSFVGVSGVRLRLRQGLELCRRELFLEYVEQIKESESILWSSPKQRRDANKDG